MNSTHISTDQLYFIQFLSSILLFIIIFTTIIGNILVITAVVTTPKLKIRSNYLILSLSITDLCVGVFLMPLMAYYEVVDMGYWMYGPVICDIKYLMTTVFTLASYMHLICIAIDRYLSVTRIQYSMNKSKSHVMAMIGISWILPVIITIWPILGFRDNQMYRDFMNENICHAIGNNNDINEFQRQQSVDKNDKLMRREFKVAKTLAIVTIVFVPYNVMNYRYIISSQTPDYKELAYLRTTIWLACFNSTLNPILYAFLNKDFRVAFKRILYYN
ncbi:unnamed protein product [Oppiella nova]|uniref:G-protein coupled receptors family 1 profile domain-containing protein n=1 Tax=Oppiella nova TaxID=334625 RepID=A0A7R9M2H7_9ACAR|nr:unnamed protein product [Oppiella nova]CAG2169549.1 unnamed protein product [Oppiella nova]